MPLDGLLLYKLCEELNLVVGGKINKVLEVSESDYIFQIRSNFKNYNLLLSASNQYFRIHLTTKKYEYPLVPKAFTMLLRKHLEGSIILDIKTLMCDRVIEIKVKGVNEIGDIKYTSLYLELMGKDSNIILVKNGIIIDAYKKENSIESKRTIFPNAKFIPYINENKIDSTTISIEEMKNLMSNVIDSKDLQKTFNGLSYKTANYIMNNLNPSNTLYSLIHDNFKTVSFLDNNKLDYYFSNIGYNKVKEYESISLMLDDIYYDKALKERVKEKSSNLFQTIKSKIKRLEEKISKLQTELDQALNLDTFKLYGELLLQYVNNKEKNDEIKAFNYYTNTDIIIPLDKKYNIIDNSKLYYKKYQKAKNAIAHINEQLNISKDELDYFNIIYQQLQSANISDILEIENELVEQKYIKKSQNKKKKKVKTKILTYHLDDDTKIYVGKNNIQNEIITHKIAKYNDTWFHVKDAPGSHVVISKSGLLNERDIRTAAMLAAFYSTYKDSSSVAIDYTMIRYIKKIPGKKACFVTYTNQKTIYIDPEKEFIEGLTSQITEY